MSFSLIIPAAADTEKSQTEMPYIFNLDNEGVMLCVRAIMGLPLSIYDAVYFTILQSHDEKYYLSALLSLQFKRLKINNAKVVILHSATQSQAETVYETIRMERISGSIFIKDADGYFSSNVESINSVAIFPLEKMNIVNLQNKSFVAVDDMFYVTNVIEKKVVSRYFNAGASCFEHAEDFCHYFEILSQYSGKLYISHIIYAMLLDKLIFRPLPVTDFYDWGNNYLFKNYINSL